MVQVASLIIVISLWSRQGKFEELDAKVRLSTASQKMDIDVLTSRRAVF
jgi:hypothetical protein